MFVEFGSGINAIGAHFVKQLVGQMVERIDRLRGFHLVGTDDDIHVRPSLFLLVVAAQSRKVVGTELMRLVVAMLARIRSLLIMIGEDSTSRSSRPMLKSPSLR